MPDHRRYGRYAEDPVPPGHPGDSRYPLLWRPGVGDPAHRHGHHAAGGQGQHAQVLRQHHLQLPHHGRSLSSGGTKRSEPGVLSGQGGPSCRGWPARSASVGGRFSGRMAPSGAPAKPPSRAEAPSHGGISAPSRVEASSHGSSGRRYSVSKSCLARGCHSPSREAAWVSDALASARRACWNCIMARLSHAAPISGSRLVAVSKAARAASGWPSAYRALPSANCPVGFCGKRSLNACQLLSVVSGPCCSSRH